MSLFFCIVALVLFLMHLIVGCWFAILFTQLTGKWLILWGPLLATVLIILISFYTRTHHGGLDQVLYMLNYGWIGCIFIWFCIAGVFILLYSLCQALQVPVSKTIWALLSIGLMVVAVLVAGYGGLRQPRVKTVRVSIPQAPSFTAAVISDSHLGMGVSFKRFEKALARLQQTQPDVLFVLGDLFEYGPHPEKYAQALANFKTKYGSFGVLGNHEYYVGYRNSVDFYKQAGITLLENQLHRLPNGVELIGVKDIITASVTETELDSLLANTNPDAIRILLSHQPLFVSRAAQHKIPLMLSGHTHNGQIFPFHLLVKLRYPYVYGLHRTGPHSYLYVTSGMFYWAIPLRLLAPAEIPLIHIQGI